MTPLEARKIVLSPCSVKLAQLSVAGANVQTPQPCGRGPVLRKTKVTIMSSLGGCHYVPLFAIDPSDYIVLSLVISHFFVLVWGFETGSYSIH